MNNKNTKTILKRPIPFHKGFGVQPTHDKPITGNGNKENKNDDKKQQGK